MPVRYFVGKGPGGFEIYMCRKVVYVQGHSEGYYKIIWEGDSYIEGLEVAKEANKAEKAAWLVQHPPAPPELKKFYTRKQREEKTRQGLKARRQADLEKLKRWKGEA